MLGDSSWVVDVEGTPQFTGRFQYLPLFSHDSKVWPFVLVNGVIWPKAPVEPRQYRLRILNGSNSRTYRLKLLDDQGEETSQGMVQIGTDGGFLPAPVSLEDVNGLNLAPAERADVLIDFCLFPGKKIKLVDVLAQNPDVLMFDVAETGAQPPLEIPAELATPPVWDTVKRTRRIGLSSKAVRISRYAHTQRPPLLRGDRRVAGIGFGRDLGDL